VKKPISYILSILLGLLKEDHKKIEESPVSPEMMIDLIKIVNAGVISSNSAKEVLAEMYQTGAVSAEIIAQKGLKQITAAKELEPICWEVIQANSLAVADFKKGKSRAFGVLVGQVMARTKGQANPQLVNEILKKIIN
jgi:aspartyl-tRNA(Asn)/glutamyl-tRNA(Gln) amidotransferase subunit B